LQGGITVSNESLTLNGVGAASDWGALDCESFETNIWAGPIIMTADSTFANYGGGNLRIIGTISGAGGLNELYGGVLSLEGTNANTYAGTTVVTVGTLNLDKVGPVGSVYAVPGSLVLSSGTTARLYQSWQLYSPARSLALMTTLNPNSVFDLNGNSEWLAQVSMSGAQITAGSGFLYLSGDITVVSNTITNSKITGNLTLYPWLSSTHNVITNTGHYFSPDFVISANISSFGTNTLIKDGDGELDINGTNNTFTGATIVNWGDLWVDYTNGLGNTNLPATVNNGGSILLQNNVSVGLKPLVLNGPGYFFGALAAFGNSTWAGNVTLAGNTTVSAYSGGENLTLSGALSGPGALTIGQSGTVILTGPADNSYAGLTTVSSGTLVLSKTGVSVPGNLVINNGSTVRLANSQQTVLAADVLVNGGGLFDFSTFFTFMNTLRGFGTVNFGVGGWLYIGANGGSSEFDGPFTGVGYAPGYTVGKDGTGTFITTGNSTYTAGVTHVLNGKYVINGSQPQIPVIVDSGATLGGSGTVGTIAASGVISPGNSPGILTSSNVTFSSSGNLTVELTGPNPGVGGYDQLNVRGTATLTSPTLTVIPAFTNPVAVGQTFTIVNNDLADPVAGTFNGLAEGAGITANGFGFRLSYVGGTGNDVVLTLTNVPMAQAGYSVTLGNGSGAIDPNECNYLSVIISNKLGTPITGISAMLVSTTPNVVITQPFAAYPDVPGNGTGSNITPFQISTTTNFACGTVINLSLNVTTVSQGSFSVPVVLSSGSPAALPSRYDNSTVTSIPDVGTLESTNTVSGFVGPLTKVVVAMYLTHTFDSDLTNISLIAPDGTTVLLSAANGGSGQNYGNNCSPDASRTTFDDAAGASITSGVAPFVGTFRPQSPLSAFNGNGTLNGNWRLHIADGFGGSLGTLRCWSLFLYGTACTPGGGLCELCPNVTLTAALGATSARQTNYLTFNGTPSTCGAPKACPGTTTGNIWPSDNYTFRNGPSDACVTVTVENDSPVVQMLATAYLGSYDPMNSDKCINYLADGGNIIQVSNPTQTFSFNVASNATFIVNLIASTTLTAPYKLTVTGGDCRPVLNVTPVAAQTVQLDWTTAAAGFGLESTNNLGGGSTNWPPVTNVPVVINSRFMVTNNAASSNQFYRLHKPY
jgi:autotransporter-associated beta strand protein